MNFQVLFRKELCLIGFLGLWSKKRRLFEGFFCGSRGLVSDLKIFRLLGTTDTVDIHRLIGGRVSPAIIRHAASSTMCSSSSRDAKSLMWEFERWTIVISQGIAGMVSTSLWSKGKPQLSKKYSFEHDLPVISRSK